MSIRYPRLAVRGAVSPVRLYLALLASCSSSPTMTPFGAESAPIIDGVPTSSWPAVGALVVVEGATRYSYCTATLIGSQWLLTAAHCVDPTEAGVPQAYVAHFFVGGDVALSGSTYVVDAITVHPDYDKTYVENDIAVVHIASPATGTTPIAYNTANITSGSAITWVGYGVNANAHVNPDGTGDGDGGGTKRYAYGAIASVGPTAYSYNRNASYQLTCFGDSGGPDLVGSTGNEKVIGVHSTVRSSSDQSACDIDGQSTRVDAYSSWIANVMAGGGPITCNIAGGSCGSQACAIVDVGVYRCLPSDHKAIGAACNADSRTWVNLPCVDGAICLDYVDGARCYEYCQTTADCSSGKTCGFVFQDLADVGLCLASACNIAGGDCGTGACFQLQGGVTQCFSSAGGAVGAGCDPTTPESSPLPCGDGLICLQTGTAATAGTCSQRCGVPTDCPAGSTCQSQTVQGIANVGVCVASSSCACNTGAGCQTACSCDPDCCDCDTDFYCDTDCACDVECPCSCDTTYACDSADSGDCACDIDCKDKGCGRCDQGAAELFVAPMILFLLFVSRRRRAVRTER
jgi:V8-like Glu-specific endopeptidase